MAEIVNLRTARKGKAREVARAKADENAARFGRTKGQKSREAADASSARALLDGAKRETLRGPETD